MQKAEGKAAAAIAERYKNKTASPDSGDISQKITGNLSTSADKSSGTGLYYRSD